jgi:integrase
MARKARKRLTPRGVLAIKREGYHADSEAVGLYVQVAYRQKDGKLNRNHGVTRSWVYRYTSPVTKKVRMMGLGSCDVVTLAEARDLARHARKLVTFGRDPIEHRNATETAEREAYVREQASKMTFAACAELYLAEQLKHFRNAKHKRQWQETLKRASRAFGDLNVAEIDTPMITKFLTPIWDKTPDTGARIRGRIERVLDWARVKEFRPKDSANPARWQGHLEHVFAPAKSGNYAAMPYDQVPAFMARLRERDSVSARALELVILTAARSGEVRGAMWDEVDLDKALWTVPASRMKMGKEHVVPLSTPAVALLKALPRVGACVFPGSVEGKPFSDMALLQQLRGLDGNGFSVHGFRSAFRDWAGEETEFENETIEFALAHGIPDSTKAAYRRYRSLNKRRLLMEQWANYLDGKAAADNVLTFAQLT